MSWPIPTPKAVGISAANGEGIDLLKDAIRQIAEKEPEEPQETPDNEDWLAEFER
jgi:GTP-binding protein HflX